MESGRAEKDTEWQQKHRKNRDILSEDQHISRTRNHSIHSAEDAVPRRPAAGVYPHMLHDGRHAPATNPSSEPDTGTRRKTVLAVKKRPRRRSRTTTGKKQRRDEEPRRRSRKLLGQDGGTEEPSGRPRTTDGALLSSPTEPPRRPAKHPQQVAAEVTRSILERKQSKGAEASTSREPEPQAPTGTQSKHHSKGDPGAKRSRQERPRNDPEAGTSANANRESTEPRGTSRERSSNPPRRGPLHDVRYVDTEIPFPEHFTFMGDTTRSADNLRRMETWNEFGRHCNPGYVSKDRTTIITNTEADPLSSRYRSPFRKGRHQLCCPWHHVLFSLARYMVGGKKNWQRNLDQFAQITNPAELDQAFMNYFPLGSIEHGEERQREWYGQGLALESLYNLLTMRYYSNAAFHKALCRTDGDYLELRGEDQFWSQNRGDRGLIGCNYYGIVLMCVREENQYADPRGLPTEDNSIPRGLRREPEVWHNTPEAATFISALGQKRLSSGSFYQIPEIPPPPFGMKYVILHRRVVLVDDNEDPAQLDGEPHDNNQGKTPGYPGPHVPRSKGIPLPSTGNPNPVVTLTTGGGVQEPASGNLMAPAKVDSREQTYHPREEDYHSSGGSPRRIRPVPTIRSAGTSSGHSSTEEEAGWVQQVEHRDSCFKVPEVPKPRRRSVREAPRKPVQTFTDLEPSETTSPGTEEPQDPNPEETNKTIGRTITDDELLAESFTIHPDSEEETPLQIDEEQALLQSPEPDDPPSTEPQQGSGDEEDDDMDAIDQDGLEMVMNDRF
jgi:hypothetical protein